MMSKNMRMGLKKICGFTHRYRIFIRRKPNRSGYGVNFGSGEAMRHAGVFLLAVAILMASLPGWSQTTTGRLMGTTVDESGAVLPGVSVTISSPALIGGKQVKTTDDRGEFMFLSLAPGDYTVNAELPGFVTQERNLVTVPLGGAAVITIAMPIGAFSGQIEVVDETPMVDTTQVNTGQIFRQEYMQDSAISSENRAYTTVVNQTAGVAPFGEWAGVPQPKVFGSTIGENAYFIDGMDATNPVMGTATAVLNFDAIGEIQFQTGGFEAEYGRATGGILNLVSKSGGNRFSGTFDARYRDDSFQESGDHFDASELSTKHQVFSATLGGPILRDKMWFFASYERINDVFTPNASPTTTDQKGQNYLGKITWQIAPAWRLSGKYTSDPTTWDNWNASRWVMPEATSQKKGTTAVLSTELTSVLSDSLLWNTTLGSYHYESNVYPMNPDLSAIGHYNFDTDLDTVNFEEPAVLGDQPQGFHHRPHVVRRRPRRLARAQGRRRVLGSVLQKRGLRNRDPERRALRPGWRGFLLRRHPGRGDGAPVSDAGDLDTGGPTDYDGAVSTVFAQDAWRPTREPDPEDRSPLRCRDLRHQHRRPDRRYGASCNRGWGSPGTLRVTPRTSFVGAGAASCTPT